MSTKSPTSAAPVKQGDILAGKYRVERVLGAGGMGVVVAATHLDLLEPRALKFMLDDALDDAEAVERFVREARAAARLKSEHVAKVYDVGRLENGAPYMVMEYLEGEDLDAVFTQKGTFSPDLAALATIQVCSALAEAHSLGIIHRDLKPSNLFLAHRPDGSPCVKVLDFGISKVSGQGAEMEMTKTNAAMGSPYYMSPEQMRSARSVDVRTDIWSLGVILYKLTTGKVPFRGQNLTELVAQVLDAAAPPPSSVRPGIAPGLEVVIMRCLRRDRDERFANVAELASALLPFAPPEAAAMIEPMTRVLNTSVGARSGSGMFSAPAIQAPPPSKPTVPRVTTASTTEKAVPPPKPVVPPVKAAAPPVKAAAPPVNRAPAPPAKIAAPPVKPAPAPPTKAATPPVKLAPATSTPALASPTASPPVAAIPEEDLEVSAEALTIPITAPLLAPPPRQVPPAPAPAPAPAPVAAPPAPTPPVPVAAPPQPKPPVPAALVMPASTTEQRPIGERTTASWGNTAKKLRTRPSVGVFVAVAAAVAVAGAIAMVALGGSGSAPAASSAEPAQPSAAPASEARAAPTIEAMPVTATLASAPSAAPLPSIPAQGATAQATPSATARPPVVPPASKPAALKVKKKGPFDE